MCFKQGNKYLGVIIDHNLNWIEHISYVKKTKFQKALEYCIRPDFFS